MRKLSFRLLPDVDICFSRQGHRGFSAILQIVSVQLKMFLIFLCKPVAHNYGFQPNPGDLLQGAALEVFLMCFEDAF